VIDALQEAIVERRHLLGQVVQRTAEDVVARFDVLAHVAAKRLLQLGDRILAGSDGLEPALQQERADDVVDDGVAERLLGLEVMEDGALGGAGGLNDAVETAALKAVLVELGEGRHENFAAGLFGGSDGDRATHIETIQTSRYVVKRLFPAPAGTPFATALGVMNVLTFLKHEHDEVKSVFGKLEKAKGAQAERLWEQLREMLQLHETMEETFFYPRLKEDKRAKDLVLESYEEHHVLDVLIGEISQFSPSDEQWQPKIKVLQENTEHHIEEEEGELFPKVRKIWDSETLDEVGKLMEQMKGEHRKGRRAA
jgi:hemerythrin superfamily protein